MRLVHHLAIIASFATASSVFAQTARETSGIQAVPLTVIDDAQNQFQQGNFKESAKDLRSAASLLRIEGKGYQAAESALINAAAGDLERLAKGIDEKMIGTARQFQNAAAAAMLSKAKANHAAAVKEWASLNHTRTSEEILATAHAVEHCRKWLDGAPSKETNELLSRAEATAKKLTSLDRIANAEVAGVIESLGDEVQLLSRIGPQPKAPSH